jgi:hypothetical protein
MVVLLEKKRKSESLPSIEEQLAKNNIIPKFIIPYQQQTKNNDL